MIDKNNSTDHYIIALPPPCTNADVHMGHLTGVYIIGDIYAKFQKDTGANVLTIGGADQNNTYTERKSIQEKKDFYETGEHYAEKIKNSLSLANVHLDAYIETSKAIHHETVNEIFTILEKNHLIEQTECYQLYCEQCQKFLCDSQLSGLCAICNNPCDGGVCENCYSPIFNIKIMNPLHNECHSVPTVKKTVLLTLNISKLKSKLEKMISSSNWDQRLKYKYLEYLSREKCEKIPLTCHYKNGIKISSLPNETQTFTIWFEAIWSFFTGLKAVYQKSINDVVQMINDKQCKIVAWMGQDSEFYYAIAFSLVCLGIGINYIPHNISVQRFVKLLGSKFSSSRGHTLFLQELLNKYHPDVIRLYSLSVIKSYFENGNNFIIEELEKLNHQFLLFREKMIHFNYPQAIESFDNTKIKDPVLIEYQSLMNRFEFYKIYDMALSRMRTIILQGLPQKKDFGDFLITLIILKPIIPLTVGEIMLKMKEIIPTASFCNPESLHMDLPLY